MQCEEVRPRLDAYLDGELTEAERNALLAGFMTIRDQERLDDVGDWANAVIALLEDEAGYEGAI